MEADEVEERSMQMSNVNKVLLWALWPWASPNSARDTWQLGVARSWAYPGLP